MIEPTHAEYADGSIRKLEKDCGCVIHDGPHWVHRDLVSRRIHEARGDVDGEIARLDQKMREMENAGIVRLLTAEQATKATA